MGEVEATVTKINIALGIRIHSTGMVSCHCSISIAIILATQFESQQRECQNVLGGFDLS